MGASQCVREPWCTPVRRTQGSLQLGEAGRFRREGAEDPPMRPFPDGNQGLWAAKGPAPGRKSVRDSPGLSLGQGIGSAKGVMRKLPLGKERGRGGGSVERAEEAEPTLAEGA